MDYYYYYYLLQHILQLPAANSWRLLLNQRYFEKGQPCAISDFVTACWSIRRAALTGRGANGGHPMALKDD